MINLFAKSEVSISTSYGRLLMQNVENGWFGAATDHKVIKQENIIIQWSAYEFQFAFHSNYVPNLHQFPRYNEILVENC